MRPGIVSFLVLFLMVVGSSCRREPTVDTGIKDPGIKEKASKSSGEHSIDSQMAGGRAEASNDLDVDESFDVEQCMKDRLPINELDEGWIRLFDGQSLTGWQPTSDADWQVENGEIHVHSGEAGFLLTTSRFADFELRLDFQADSATNSGIFLRSASQPSDPTADCYELNIAPDDNPFPTGSLVGRAKVNLAASVKEISDAWRTLHVLVDGDHVQVWLDGQPVVDYRDAKNLESGLIGLQYREGSVKFRNIRIRPILLSHPLPAKDLSQWSVAEDSPAQFTLEPDGSLSIRGGKGQIELLQPFGNFCLQAEAMLQSDETNSGIFFRCIPGEEMNGYECQLNNAYDGDRRRPVDGGTGAIFRRQPARAVLANNQEWMHITIVADGPHISTWVEGMQVVDWTDTRKPHENPRSGLRLEPGSVILQAHDAKCDAKFRKLSIMLIP